MRSEYFLDRVRGKESPGVYKEIYNALRFRARVLSAKSYTPLWRDRYHVSAGIARS
jgi:hypothetical protein